MLDVFKNVLKVHRKNCMFFEIDMLAGIGLTINFRSQEKNICK